MDISQFDYHLPSELIAQYPLPERSASRLCVVPRDQGDIQHQYFTDFVDLLNPNDLLVFNNTKVIAARLFGKKISGGKVECLVERIINNLTFLAHIKASKAPKINTDICIAGEIIIRIVNRHDDLFECCLVDNKSIYQVLDQFGHIPLPPYIQREDKDVDHARYQTIYAECDGAVAAPTAGLHFDDAMMQRVEEKNIARCFVTLHVGAGTFQPVRVDNITQHKMHSEWIDVSKSVCDAVNVCKQQQGRVIAIGTTSMRALETASLQGSIKPFTGDTDIFIYPGIKFHCVDALLTNFHLPKSTLLMLVTAFGGYQQVMQAYQQAIEQRYRFFSYGDAMFLSR